MKLTRQPILCYVTDRASLPIASGASRKAALRQRLRAAAAAGLDWIELREKDLEGAALLDLARGAVAALAAGAERPRLLINDRLDVALAAGADGVHLPESSLPLSAVAQWKREANRAEFLVGVSCHSREAVERAAREGAGYVFFGPVFETPSKTPFGAPHGLGKLAEVCRAVSIPVLAIGGIRVESAADCIAAGAAGVAAIGLFQSVADLPELVAGLRKKLA